MEYEDAEMEAITRCLRRYAPASDVRFHIYATCRIAVRYTMHTKAIQRGGMG